MSSFIELAAKSNFSFLEGASHPEELVVTAAALGSSGLAVCDRNTLAGVVRVHLAGKEVGIRTAVGCHLTFDDGTPNILAWPCDRAAYGRLCRLLTVGNMRGAKDDCRLLLSDLVEWCEGLILAIVAGSAAPDRIEGTVAALVPHVRHRLRLAVSMQYGPDDQRRLAADNAMARRLGLRPLATTLPLYHTPARRPLQDVLTAIRLHTTVDAAGRKLGLNAERHVKSPAEIAQLFAQVPEAVEETAVVMAEVAFSLDELRYEYPEEPTDPGLTPQQTLVRLTLDGAARRYPHGVPAKVRALLKHELELIESLDYAPYFLTVYDIVRFARDNAILAQGRGSAANSAVCFCLGVTEVDPERSDLLFERFISPERREPPDIDVDFEHERREEVIQYIYEKYGRDRAGIAATVVSYRARSAAREIGKALGFSEDAVSAMSGSIWGWGTSGVAGEDAARAGLDPSDHRVGHLVRLSQEIAGFPRHLSQHVGGFVITRGRLDEMVPIVKASMDGRTNIEWDKDDLDSLGILKIDVLALGMLTCVRKGLGLLVQHYGLDFAAARPGGEGGEHAPEPVLAPAGIPMLADLHGSGDARDESDARSRHADVVAHAALPRNGFPSTRTQRFAPPANDDAVPSAAVARSDTGPGRNDEAGMNAQNGGERAIEQHQGDAREGRKEPRVSRQMETPASATHEVQALSRGGSGREPFAEGTLAYSGHGHSTGCAPAREDGRDTAAIGIRPRGGENDRPAYTAGEDRSAGTAPQRAAAQDPTAQRGEPREGDDACADPQAGAAGEEFPPTSPSKPGACNDSPINKTQPRGIENGPPVEGDPEGSVRRGSGDRERQDAAGSASTEGTECRRAEEVAPARTAPTPVAGSDRPTTEPFAVETPPAAPHKGVPRADGVAATLASIPAEDSQVYDMICRADTLGVFQIESRAQMSMLPRLRPRTFYDLVIEVAIVRPGPIQGDMVHPYLRRRQGKEPVTYPSKELEEVLAKTLGVPLFQEQAMKIAIVAAGFSPAEADQLRRAMATFRRVGTIGTFEQKMVDGMTAKGYDPEFARRCFNQIEGFGEYGFPESHAASFALLVYSSCWLKCHYPDVFCAALLNSQPMGFYAPAQIVRDARQHGVEVRPVDINLSDWDCTLEPGPRAAERLHPNHAEMADAIRAEHAVRLGLRQVKGLAEEDMHRLVARRGAGYDSVRDLWLRTGLGRSTIERLAEADAFGSLGLSRREALWGARGLDQGTKVEDLPLFAATGVADLQKEAAASLPPMPPGEEVINDYRFLSLSLKAHPAAFVRPDLKRERIWPAARITAALAGRRVSVAGLVLVRQRPGSAKGVIFMTVEDETGIANVIVWPKVFEAFRSVVLGARFVKIIGRVQAEDDVVHMVADRLEDRTHLLTRLADSAEDWDTLDRADEVKRPGQDPREGPPPATRVARLLGDVAETGEPSPPAQVAAALQAHRRAAGAVRAGRWGAVEPDVPPPDETHTLSPAMRQALPKGRNFQ